MPATFSRVRLRIAIPLSISVLVVVLAGLRLAAASSPYNVESGDTLYSIAGKMGVASDSLADWVDEVVAINSLKSPDALTVGQQLTLPAGGSDRSSSADRTTGSAAANASTTSYIIRPGDTLYDIAARNGVSEGRLAAWIESVLKLNNLENADALKQGERLKLPSTRAGASPATATRGTSGSQTVQYTVQPGDTLYDIALKQGIAEGDLTSWLDTVLKLNDLSSPDLLSQGKALKVPSKRLATASAAGSGRTAPAKPLQTISYIIKSGDTLHDIALSKGVSDGQISEWMKTVVELNNLASADTLTVGDSLKLPSSGSGPGSSNAGAARTSATVTYVVKPGDTLLDIAAKNGMVDPGLRAWLDTVMSLNDLASADVLKEGDSLKLPATEERSPGAPPTQAVDPSLFVSGGSVTYNVKRGDTWPGIARQYNVPEAQIDSWVSQAMALSHLSKDDKLEYGVVLLVPTPAPVSSARDSASTTSPTSSGSSPSLKPSRSKPTTEYTVQAGDTLSDIGAKFKVGFAGLSAWIREVLDLNDLSSADMLRAGQTLVVPDERPSASSGAGGTNAGTASASGGQSTQQSKPGSSTPSLPASGLPPGLIRGPNSTCFYTVLAGDTWEGLTQKLGVAPESRAAWIEGIRALNNVQGNALPVGDALRMLC